MTKGTTRAAKRNAERQAANDAALAATVSPEEAVRNRIRAARLSRDEAERARIQGLQEPAPAVGPNALALRLASNRDVTAELDYAHRYKRAMRYDVFSLLYYAPSSKLASTSYDAVRRLQTDLAILHRTQGASDAIRSTSSGAGSLAAAVTGFSALRADAGQRIADVLDGMLPWASRLIRDLCETEVTRGQTPNWHAIVQRHTGETNRVRRGDLVRRACDDLAASWREYDNRPARRAS